MSDQGTGNRLNLQPNIPDPDGFYAELLSAHEGLDDDASAAYNARLILLLANHIGNRDVLIEALSAAALSAPTCPESSESTHR